MHPAPVLVAASACLGLYLLTTDGGEGIDSALSSFDSLFYSADDMTLQNNNVKAFLALIRYGESANTGDAYSMLYGGGHFSDYTDHPRQFFTLADGRRTSAAGAYQITWTTWQWVSTLGSLPDFSPHSQDLAALLLIKRRGALADVIAGNFDRAIAKCRNEWTSLPGAMESRYTLAKARQILAQYGATFEDTTA